MDQRGRIRPTRCSTKAGRASEFVPEDLKLASKRLEGCRVSGAITGKGGGVTGSRGSVQGVLHLQTVSIIGASVVLGAFVANQLGWITPSRLSYALANFVGAGLLTVVAVVDRQVGFMLLQGSWTLISLWGAAAVLRSRRPGEKP